MGGNDGPLMPSHDGKEFSEADPGRAILQMRQTINQEMTFDGGDLGTRENLERSSLRRQFLEFGGLPLVVVLGDDQAIEAQRRGSFHELVWVDHTVRRVAGRVEVMVDFHVILPEVSGVGGLSKLTGWSLGMRAWGLLFMPGIELGGNEWTGVRRFLGMNGEYRRAGVDLEEAPASLPTSQDDQAR